MIKKEKEPYKWQWENSINSKDRYIEFGAAGEPAYESRRTNKSLSNHADTIIHANEMNISWHLDSKLQYDYLYNTIRKKKRRFKHRYEKDEYFTLVQQYYKYSDPKTHAALAVLTKEQLSIIKRKMDKGGIR